MRKIFCASAALLVLLLLAGCPVKQQLPLELRATPQREQTQTNFTIVGSGFTPSQTVTLSLMLEPGRAENSRVIRTVTADPSGHFATDYTANYLYGPDPGTHSPAFVARDNASGSNKIAAVSSAYWYTQL